MGGQLSMGGVEFLRGGIQPWMTLCDAAAMYLSKYPEREEEIQRRYQPRIELFEKKIEDQAIY